MFWSTFLTCTLAALAGALGFWLTTALHVKPLFLLFLGPPLVFAGPPDIASALIVGGWLAAGFFLRAHEGIPAPNESLGWRRVFWDALAINVAFLVGLFYMYRQRAGAPGPVVAMGVILSFVVVLCYFHATAWDITRRLRVVHGYAVGLVAFIPWAFILSRLGWTVLGLGFLSFLLLPPFFLATLDLNLSIRHKRRRHHRLRTPIRMP